jgi:FAD/FMN-containing dehydrogenase
MATIHEPDTALTGSFAGQILRPGDPGFDEARAVWNGMFDRRPAMILRCRTTEDVVAAVGVARTTGLEVAVRAGGHSLSGQSTTEGGLLIDLSPMRGIEIDTERRLARVEPGVTWSELDAATGALGLATTGGLIPSTGVAGLTLGGGIGWLMRKHGLACDNLVGAEVVTADGRRIQASAAGDPELLWGLRGGGGNFGIVTSFELWLHPVSTVLGGLMLFPIDRGREVLRTYRSWVETLPDDFTTLAAVAAAPPAPFVPRQLVGQPVVAILGCFVGDIEAGQELLAPIRAQEPLADVFGPMPYPALQAMLADGAPAGLRSRTSSGYLADLDDELIDVILGLGAALPTPLSQIHLHQMGGAVARVGEADTAFGHRRAAWTYNLLATWEDPSDDERSTRWVANLVAAVRPHATGGVYVNFLGAGEEDRVRSAYDATTYRRLAELKRRLDPENLFRRNHNIPPATS